MQCKICFLEFVRNTGSEVKSETTGLKKSSPGGTGHWPSKNPVSWSGITAHIPIILQFCRKAINGVDLKHRGVGHAILEFYSNHKNSVFLLVH